MNFNDITKNCFDKTPLDEILLSKFDAIKIAIAKANSL
jgi:hypothetical protein